MLFLKTTEEEGLIFDNRSAHREPIVFIPEPGCFRKLGARYEEGRVRCIKFIPVVIVGRSVQCVAAALEDQVRRPPCVAAGFGVRCGLHGEFVNRINRHHHSGDTRDSSLVDCRNVVPKIIVVCAVDLPVHLISARSIYLTEAADVIPAKARLDGQQLGEVAPIERHFLNHSVRHCRSLRLRRRIQCECRGGHFHRRRALL